MYQEKKMKRRYKTFISLQKQKKYEFINVCEKITSSFTKTNIIELFCKSIPNHFDMFVFGSAVAYIFSKVEPNNIDLIENGKNEILDFIKIMKQIYQNSFDWNFTIRDGPYKKITRCYLNINNISLKIDIVAKNDYNKKNRDFVESSLIFAKYGFKFDHYMVQTLKKAKNNLTKKLLTLYPEIYYQTNENKINVMKRIVNKFLNGYKIIGSFPAIDDFGFYYINNEMKSTMFNMLPLITDIMNIVLAYLDFDMLKCSLCQEIITDTFVVRHDQNVDKNKYNISQSIFNIYVFGKWIGYDKFQYDNDKKFHLDCLEMKIKQENHKRHTGW
jgi:hypothetical protein